MNKMDWKVLLFISILGGLLTGCEAKAYDSKLKLVIDHDGGADDAMAVSMCILYEKYFDGPEVVALTTTHGNVNESQSYKNSQRFLDISGRRDVPIYRGATGALVISVESDYYFGHDGLGDNQNNTFIKQIKAQEEHAAIALIELSKKYKGQLLVMAIGPQTNIALAQTLDPGFIGRLAQLYVGAGTVHSELSPDPEFNAEMDVEAYRIVADNSIKTKVTVVPFSQIMASLTITKEWRTNVLGAIDTPLMRSLNSFERLSLADSDEWQLLDPAVAALVLHDDVVCEYNYYNNNISLCGPDRGINSNRQESEQANMRLVESINEETYKKLLINTFSAELNVCVKKNRKT